MLKIHSDNKKNVTLIVVGVAAVLCFLSIGYFIYSSISPEGNDSGIDYSAPTPEQIEGGEIAKKQAIDRKAREGATPSLTDVDMVDFSTIKKDQSLVVTTRLDNRVSWDKCKLELQQGSVAKSYDARTVYQSEASFCGGFTVPLENMNGTWQITLIATDLGGKEYKKMENVDVN